jgi:PI-3-kinase-related kinase SMG-1
VEQVEACVRGRQDAAAWWAVQEAARHCVANRLRTHLGGPTHTFAALEKMLQAVAAMRFAEEDGGSAGVPLTVGRMLLDFMEALERHAYNAYEGSCLLAPAPSACLPFFRGNRKVRWRYGR